MTAANDAELAVDLFAGPGGLDQGARLAGWLGQILGFEWDRDACDTAEVAGHGRVCGDVARMPAELFAGLVRLLLGSPPCPSFSAAGYGGGRHLLALLCQAVTEALQGRAQLGRTRRECLRVLQGVAAAHPKLSRLPRAERSAWAWRQATMSVLSVQPARWVHATRPRLIVLEQVPEVLPLWRHMAAMLAGLGYRTWTGVLSAEQYGVPQTRKRAVLIASLDGPVRPPVPTHQAYRAGRAAQTEPDRAMWVHDRPSTTVCGDPRIGRPGHKDRDKGEAQFAADSVRVTVQEAGILQSFPADYPWQGNSSKQYLQVGNAVPPLLGAAIMRPLFTADADRRGAA